MKANLTKAGFQIAKKDKDGYVVTPEYGHVTLSIPLDTKEQLDAFMGLAAFLVDTEVDLTIASPQGLLSLNDE